uniref:Nudix hydrolase domain-containing protein n=1 Tax=Timema bartmani TaxID=61472 RepID=A0A7R9I062_9NEOP|nr:unnamed protein product [Timema bartmani]
MSKHWKDAASIIICSRTSFYSHNNSCQTNKFPNPNYSAPKPLDYKILTLKRSIKSSFMPETYVFPGGKVDEADLSMKWMDLFKEIGIGDLIKTWASKNKEFGNSLFQNPAKYEIPKLLSLRITAIRETFEECGLLLCKRKNTFNKDDSNWASYLSGHEILQWQRRVQKDPSEFFNLCKHFECYPDVLALQAWRVWLTPTHRMQRFNTAFFLTTLDQRPPTIVDELEATEVRWDTSEKLLELSQSGRISVPIPQIYELTKIKNFRTINSLMEFASNKNNESCAVWMSIHKKCDEGIVAILPGDDTYPENPDFTAVVPVERINGSFEGLRRACHRLNRMENYDGNKWEVVVNIDSGI